LDEPLEGGPAIARARLTIDLEAIAANWRALDALSAPGVETAAVVKADAYGLGVARVGPVLAAAGARSFFVALAEEGAVLREALGPEPDIFVFAGLMPGDASLVQAHRLVPCLNSPGQIADFERTLAGRPCAVQLDSGMNRLGLEPAELNDALPALARLAPALAISHLACADEPAHPMNRAQAAAFEALAGHLPGIRRSLAATGGILLGRAWHFDLVRPGIGLYGGRPYAGARPVVRLSLPVVQVREVAEGEAVGYGAAWTAVRPSRIATVSAGYADGLARALGRGHLALFAGETAVPVVGRVSMDLLTVDVTGLEEVPASLDILNDFQGIDAVADVAGTIGYEVLTSLGPRYDRVYKEAPPPECA
jgi:alanine racemase